MSNDQSSVNPPVGRTPPFTGDLQQIWHCAGVVLERAKAKEFLSKELHQYLAQGYGEAATAFLKDPGPVPVGSAVPPSTIEGCCESIEERLREETAVQGVGAVGINVNAWLGLFLQLIRLVQEEMSK